MDGDIYVDGTLYGDGSGLTGISSASIADDSLDYDKFADAMTVDADTTVDMDTNAADLNFDSDTFMIDSSTNRVGVGTSTPSVELDVGDGTLTAPLDGVGDFLVADDAEIDGNLYVDGNIYGANILDLGSLTVQDGAVDQAMVQSPAMCEQEYPENKPIVRGD